MENIIAVDSLDCEIGAIEKMEAHHKGILHRAFSILVFNSKQELLLQKRHGEKYHSPGLWTNTCCSHPRYGEDLKEAVYRRLQEEMGFTCPLKEVFSFIYKVELEDHMIEHEYDHVFIGIYDGEVAPNDEEVEAYKWTSLNEIREDITQNPENYTYWFKILFDRAEEKLFEHFNNLS